MAENPEHLHPNLSSTLLACSTRCHKPSCSLAAVDMAAMSRGLMIPRTNAWAHARELCRG